VALHLSLESPVGAGLFYLANSRAIISYIYDRIIIVSSFLGEFSGETLGFKKRKGHK
jgi:hypothetical protein